MRGCNDARSRQYFSCLAFFSARDPGGVSRSAMPVSERGPKIVFVFDATGSPPVVCVASLTPRIGQISASSKCASLIWLLSWIPRRDLRAMRKRPQFSAIPTASGGIARAAYARALEARLEVGPLLKSCDLTTHQIKNSQFRIPCNNQIKFLNAVADEL